MASRLLALRAPRWFAATVAFGIGAGALYLIAASRWPWQPGRLGGLLFGSAAMLLFINAGLYPWRRRLQARPLGTAQKWLRLHVYGSVLGLVFVGLHMGLRLPAGVMGSLLLGLSIWTVAGGLAGVWLQRVGPLALAHQASIDAIYERIPELVGRLAAEADMLMTGAPAVLSRAYATQIRPRLATPRASVGWMTGARVVDEESAAALAAVRPFLDASGQQKLSDLESILHDKAGLDLQLSVQRVLRGWLILHVPPAMVLIALLTIHVIAVVTH